MQDEVREVLTPEKAMKMLQEGGLDVDIEQTKMILDLLYKLTAIAMDQCFENPE